jgi:hypothetical protein
MLMPIDTIRDTIWNEDKRSLSVRCLKKFLSFGAETLLETVDIVLSGRTQRWNSCESTR